MVTGRVVRSLADAGPAGQCDVGDNRPWQPEEPSDPRLDIMLRLEGMAERELKENAWFVQSNSIPVLNVVIGGVSLAVQIAFMAHAFRRLFGALASGKRWSHRRKYWVSMHYIWLLLQVVNNAVFVAANRVTAARYCRIGDGVVIWSGFVSWALCMGPLFMLFAVHAHNAMGMPQRQQQQQQQQPAKDLACDAASSSVSARLTRPLRWLLSQRLTRVCDVRQENMQGPSRWQHGPHDRRNGSAGRSSSGGGGGSQHNGSSSAFAASLDAGVQQQPAGTSHVQEASKGDGPCKPNTSSPDQGSDTECSQQSAGGKAGGGCHQQRRQALVLDAPFVTTHWPKLAVLIIHIGVALAFTVVLQTEGLGQDPGIITQLQCRNGTLNCNLGPAALTLACINIATLVGLLLLWAVYIRLAARQHQNRPHGGSRSGAVRIRFQIRFMSYAIVFFVCSCCLLFFVKVNTCASFVETWLGFAPLHLVLTVLTIGLCYIYMPVDVPRDDMKLQAYLQVHCWDESGLRDKLQWRNASLPSCNQLEPQPMFCFERALKLFYWSELCYYTKQANSGLDIETAMQLYNLKQYEIMWDKDLDIKVLLGWNNNTIVLAFRGTASARNVIEDCKMWLRSYPTRGPSQSWLNRPGAHAGFVHAWQAHGLDRRVLSRVQEIVDASASNTTDEGSPVKVLLTGHSLGGAMATLAAVDLAQSFEASPRISLCVYTFGPPRTGNHSFAKHLHSLVPDTWAVINDQDAITRSGKWFHLYKRVGHRVYIDKQGTMLVRPSFVEASLRRAPGRAHPSDHMLFAYRRAFVAVLLAQFDDGGFAGGAQGALRLAQSLPLSEVINMRGKGGSWLSGKQKNVPGLTQLMECLEHLAAGDGALLADAATALAPMQESAGLGVAETQGQQQQPDHTSGMDVAAADGAGAAADSLSAGVRTTVDSTSHVNAAIEMEEGRLELHTRVHGS